ncbi:regenerating islet-derived protein 4-like [Drosophila ficusphila]|uniref:regenerating islet-derived protein 4-like n=1 Tax=Drosophila ficusphila TaxID=30025 RepID=UPI0007E7EFEF|nr:regenerating islet-derived protein 4-like [Drosophila ficusphila]
MRSAVLIGFFLGLAWSHPEPELSPSSPAPGNGTSEEDKVPAFSPFSFRDGSYAMGSFAKVNWFQAQETCASYGYTLVSITSQADQNNLRNFLFRYARSQQELLNDPLWTSGTDLASDNNWVWFSNGRTINYRNFQDGKPSRYEAHCLGINGFTGLWVNESCDEQRYFICEKRCQFDDDVY